MKLLPTHKEKQSGIIKILLLFVLVFVGITFLLFFVGKSVSNVVSTGPSTAMTDTSRRGGSVVSSPTNNLLSFLNNSGTSYSNPNSGGGNFGGSVLSVSAGNASYEIQPSAEYVTIRNSSSVPIDITGYTLTNSKGSRPIETIQNQNITTAVPDRLVIPQGTKYLSPDSKYVLQNIVLEPGGTAYVLTGGPFVSYSMPISASFQDNKCEGYLSKIYPFTPYLSKSCPRLDNEIGAESVSQQCYDYLKTIYSCIEPAKYDKVRYEAQTSICRSFVDSVASYKGCYNRHVSDSNFLSKDWRIFLGRRQEMWASRNESIRLYDKAGKLVTQVSY